MINIKEEIRKISFIKKLPGFLQDFIAVLIEKVIRLSEMNSFLLKHKDSTGIYFIDDLFEYLDFSFIISQKDLEKIPSEGRLLIFANHPLGALDALALIKAVSNVRGDVKIIANEIIMKIPNLYSFVLPYNIFSGSLQRENVKAIGKALDNEEAVIIFPAAEVSRLKLFTIKDKKWNKGIIYFASKYQSPVLPVYIHARNSVLFYLISVLSKSMSAMLLPREMFNKRNKNISLTIGEQIPVKVLNSLLIEDKGKLKLLRKHLYSISKKKKRNI